MLKKSCRKNDGSALAQTGRFVLSRVPNGPAEAAALFANLRDMDRKSGSSMSSIGSFSAGLFLILLPTGLGRARLSIA